MLYIVLWRTLCETEWGAEGFILDTVASPLLNPSDTECGVLFGAPLEQNIKPSLGLLWFLWERTCRPIWGFFGTDCESLWSLGFLWDWMWRPLWGSFGTEYGGLFGVPLERDVKAFWDSCRTEYRGLFWILVGQTSRASGVYLFGTEYGLYDSWRTEYEGQCWTLVGNNAKACLGFLLETCEGLFLICVWQNVRACCICVGHNVKVFASSLTQNEN